MEKPVRVPTQAWVVTAAGTAVNLCLGILYAWSVWKDHLKAGPAGTPMSGVNEGWVYLTDAEATWAYVICGMVFALCMIPGGRIQDRFGPRVGATLSGLCLTLGCIVAGLLRSYVGLVLGFGLIGGLGMGLGYAAATPAAVKWFGAHQRGLVVGLVVGGFGGAAIYISPLADLLIQTFGLSGSFIALGLLFGVVVVGAGQLLAWPPAGYAPPQPPSPVAANVSTRHFAAGEMLRTWQFYLLFFLFFCSAQAGVLVIANAKPLLSEMFPRGSTDFLAANAWIMVSFSGVVNMTGRIATGDYSDRIGRARAYALNGAAAAVLLALTPAIVGSQSGILLFVAVGVVCWQYGGGLALMPAFTADFFGSKNLGMNYGLLFLAWGLAFLMPLLAGYVKDLTGVRDYAFYGAALLQFAAVLASFALKPMRPSLAGAAREEAATPQEV